MKELNIIRGQEAFIAFINEEDLYIIADKYNIKISTLTNDMNKYINRILEPKPTVEQLKLYDGIKTRKRTMKLAKTKKRVEATEEDPFVYLEIDSFNAFLQSIDNPSVLVDLAFKHGVEPAAIVNRAVAYSKRIDQYKPSEEDLEKFNYVQQERKNLLHKEQSDFTYVEGLLSIESNIVKDYLEYVINGDLSLSNIKEKIDTYIKHHQEKPLDIKKLKLLKIHLDTNKEYINTNRKKESYAKNSNIIVSEYTSKIESILEESVLRTNTLNYLLNRYKVTKQTFDKYLKTFEEGTDKQQLLFREYQNIQEEEKELIGSYINTIFYHLINGIEKDGEIEKFNILDYYKLTKMDPKELTTKAWQYVGKGLYNRGPLQRVISFLDQFSREPILDEERLLEEEMSYNNQTIDNETKLHILEYLRTINAVNKSAFFTAMKEHLNGKLELNAMSLE